METYKKCFVYLFSGTGNSQNVTRWIEIYAKENNIDISVFDIAKVNSNELNKPEPDSLIVFISPIHGFNYPPIMINFLLRFPKGRNNVLLMNTRAGMLLGKFITPGLTGIAFYFSSLILIIKGYKIIGFLPIDLPSNWLMVHPALNDKTVKYLYDQNRIKVFSFISQIFEGKTYFKCFKEIVQDTLVAPIAILYYLIGRFFLSKTLYASNECNNCGICIKNCPVNAIKLINNRPYWTFSCESCMKCVGNCPHKAIQVGHGFTIAVLIVKTFVISTIYYYLEANFFNLEESFLNNIFGPLVLLSLVWILYRLTHYFLTFKLFRKIFVYSSLTKYKFWSRRYKAPKVN